MKPEPPQPLRRRVSRYKLLLWLGLGVFAADQLSKLAVSAAIPFGAYSEPEAISVIPGFFNIIHVGNTGAAWSLFAGRSLWLALIATITLLAIYVWRRTLLLHVRLVQVAFGLLCGGILGNLVDRLRHGYVTDFIDLHFGSYVYPTFNVADSGICVGVALYLWFNLKNHH